MFPVAVQYRLENFFFKFEKMLFGSALQSLLVSPPWLSDFLLTQSILFSWIDTMKLRAVVVVVSSPRQQDSPLLRAFQSSHLVVFWRSDTRIINLRITLTCWWIEWCGIVWFSDHFKNASRALIRTLWWRMFELWSRELTDHPAQPATKIYKWCARKVYK